MSVLVVFLVCNQLTWARAWIVFFFQVIGRARWGFLYRIHIFFLKSDLVWIDHCSIYIRLGTFFNIEKPCGSMEWMATMAHFPTGGIKGKPLTIWGTERLTLINSPSYVWMWVGNDRTQTKKKKRNESLVQAPSYPFASITLQNEEDNGLSIPPQSIKGACLTIPPVTSNRSLGWWVSFSLQVTFWIVRQPPPWSLAIIGCLTTTLTGAGDKKGCCFYSRFNIEVLRQTEKLVCKCGIILSLFLSTWSITSQRERERKVTTRIPVYEWQLENIDHSLP